MKVTVFSDFVCPFCYMNWESLHRAREQVEVEIEWRAFELRPGGALPPDEVAAMIAERWPTVRERGATFGAEIRSYHFGVDSRPAHRAFKIVRALAPAQAESFGRALYRAYFRDDRDIGDAEVLAALAEGVGVNAEELCARLDAGEALDEVIADEQAAEALGVTSIPTTLFPSGERVQGPQPAEAWVERLAALGAPRLEASR